MRAFLSIAFLTAALWRLVQDWQATIGHGYAFRLGGIGDVIETRWPQDYANLVNGLVESGVPFAWDPVGAFVLSLPLALILAAVALGIWLTRPAGPSRRYG